MAYLFFSITMHFHITLRQILALTLTAYKFLEIEIAVRSISYVEIAIGGDT